MGSEALLIIEASVGRITRSSIAIDSERAAPGFVQSLSRDRNGSRLMDKDRVAGLAKEIKGAVKEAVGKLVGDAKLQAEGRAGKTEGRVQNTVGGLKDSVRK